jgi:inner membrane protein
MPTILSHAAVPLALAVGLGGHVISPRLLVAGVAASILPDLDVLAFRLNIAYGDTFGHRGASHSIGFAALVAFVTLLLAHRLNSGRVTAFLFVAICTVSHGILDMFTNGGHGVALWWPLSSERMFAPWQVIEVSPLSLHRFLSARGLEVLQSELFWVWLPAILVTIALVFLRSGTSRLNRS